MEEIKSKTKNIEKDINKEDEEENYPIHKKILSLESGQKKM